MAVFYKSIESPIGILNLCSDEQHLLSISFDGELCEQNGSVPDVLVETLKQLEEYFSGTRQVFDLLLNPGGTDFQKKVWEKVSTVIYGSTMSYVDIAKILGSSTFCRAVGMANGRNPIPIIIPCHRIIGNNGKLTGYAGGLERKRWLLLHEKMYSGKSGLFSDES